MLLSSLLVKFFVILLLIDQTRPAPKYILDFALVIDNVRHPYMREDIPGHSIKTYVMSPTRRMLFVNFLTAWTKKVLEEKRDVIDTRVAVYTVGMDKNSVERLVSPNEATESAVVKKKLERETFFNEGPIPKEKTNDRIVTSLKWVRDKIKADNKDNNRDVPVMLFWYVMGERNAFDNYYKAQDRTQVDPSITYQLPGDEGCSKDRCSPGSGHVFGLTKGPFIVGDYIVRAHPDVLWEPVSKLLDKCEWTVHDGSCHFVDKKRTCKLAREFIRGAKADSRWCFNGWSFSSGDCKEGIGKCDDNCRKAETEDVGPCSVTCGKGKQTVRPKGDLHRYCDPYQKDCDKQPCSLPPPPPTQKPPPATPAPPAKSSAPPKTPKPTKRSTEFEETPTDVDTATEEETSPFEISTPPSPGPLEGWKIALIIIGSLFLLAIILGILFCCIGKGKRRTILLRRRPELPRERRNDNHRGQYQQRSFDSRGRMESDRRHSSSGNERQPSHAPHHSPSTEIRRPSRGHGASASVAASIDSHQTPRGSKKQHGKQDSHGRNPYIRTLESSGGHQPHSGRPKYHDPRTRSPSTGHDSRTRAPSGSQESRTKTRPPSGTTDHAGGIRSSGSSDQRRRSSTQSPSLPDTSLTRKERQRHGVQSRSRRPHSQSPARR